MIKRSLVCAAMVFAVFFAAAPISAYAAEGAKDTNGKRVTATRSADSNTLYRTGPASADAKETLASVAAKSRNSNGNIKVIDKRRYNRSVYNDNRTFSDGFSFLIGLGIGSRRGDRPWFYRPRPMVQVNNWWNYSWREYVPSWDYDFLPYDDSGWDDLEPWSDFDPWYDGGYYDPAGSDLDLIAPQTDVIDDSDDEEVIIVPQEELPSHMEYEYVPNNDPMFGPDSQPLPESMAGPEPMPGFEPALGPEPMPELEDDYGGDDYGGWD